MVWESSKSSVRRQLTLAVRLGTAWLKRSMGGVPARPDCRVEEPCAPPDDAGLPGDVVLARPGPAQGEWCELRTGTPDPGWPQK